VALERGILYVEWESPLPLPYHTQLRDVREAGKETMTQSFKKAPPGIRTAFLFVANCGPGVSMSIDDVKNMLAPENTPDKVIVPENESASYIFLLFSSPEKASDAMASFSFLPEHISHGRKMKCTYANVQREKVT
jgi:hypothetical protein